MSSLINKLAQEGILLCPNCRGAQWQLTPESLHCDACGTDWPIRNQVPDLFNQYQPRTSAKSSTSRADKQALVDAIHRALEFETDGAMPARVVEIVERASSWSCEDDAYTAEINDLLDRFAPSPKPVEAGPPPAPNQTPSFRLERHYLPESLAANSRISANMRVTNTGDAPWSSRLAEGLLLSASWPNAAGDRATAPAEVRFPIDIAPGRTISLPMSLSAPRTAGAHQLRLQLKRMDTGEPVGNACDLDVTVNKPARRPGLWQRLTLTPASQDREAPKVDQQPQIADYGKDHAAGVALIESSLDALGVSHARILEVGSGTHPHTAWLTEHEVVALDISSPLLELGSLYFGDRFIERLGFICADAFAAPFAPQSFDLVCMFSALHHFQEPETILRQLSGLLKPGGQLGVMCEPVGESLEQPETVRDLLKGINEQVFTVAEYGQIFASAGLITDRIQVDGASLKTLLRRSSEHRRD